MDKVKQRVIILLGFPQGAGSSKTLTLAVISLSLVVRSRRLAAVRRSSPDYRSLTATTSDRQGTESSCLSQALNQH